MLGIFPPFSWQWLLYLFTGTVTHLQHFGNTILTISLLNRGLSFLFFVNIAQYLLEASAMEFWNCLPSLKQLWKSLREVMRMMNTRVHDCHCFLQNLMSYQYFGLQRQWKTCTYLIEHLLNKIKNAYITISCAEMYLQFWLQKDSSFLAWIGRNTGRSVSWTYWKSAGVVTPSEFSVSTTNCSTEDERSTSTLPIALYSIAAIHPWLKRNTKWICFIKIH